MIIEAIFAGKQGEILKKSLLEVQTQRFSCGDHCAIRVVCQHALCNLHKAKLLILMICDEAWHVDLNGVDFLHEKLHHPFAFAVGSGLLLI